MLTESEREFVRKVKNWTPKPAIFRGGWPDFFLLYPDGSHKFVEIKSPSYPDLNLDQIRMHKALRKGGLDVEVMVFGRGGIANPRPRGFCPLCKQEVLLNKREEPVRHEPCGYVWHHDGELLSTNSAKIISNWATNNVET